MKNRIRTALAVLSGLAAAAALHAESYQWELGASYITGDSDIEDIEINEDNIALRGTYYFTDVNPGARSLHEAPFLQRTSFVTLEADIEDLDDDLDNAVDTDTFSVNTSLIHPENGWHLNLGYITAEADFDGPETEIVGYSPAYDGYSAAVGKYIARNTTLQLGYTELDVDGDFFIATGSDEADNDTLGIQLKHFGTIAEQVSYLLEANYYVVDLQVAEFDNLDDDPFADSGDVYSAAFTLYPMRELGVGLSYSDSDDLMGAPYLTSTRGIEDGLGVFAEWFVTERISLRALYNNEEYDIANPDNLDEPGEVEGDSLLFGATFRL